jgi:hypothetical protein
MHDHATAVLDRPTEATPASTPGVCARDRWLAKCQADLAEALATRNADLLPVLPELVFAPETDLCGDCHGTGYDTTDFDLCYCMRGDQPAYDFPRLPPAEARCVMGHSERHRVTADTWYSVSWVPCRSCQIGPIKDGPRAVPWQPDCPACQDTGWTYKSTILIPHPARSGL